MPSVYETLNGKHFFSASFRCNVRCFSDAQIAISLQSAQIRVAFRSQMKHFSIPRQRRRLDWLKTIPTSPTFSGFLGSGQVKSMRDNANEREWLYIEWRKLEGKKKEFRIILLCPKQPRNSQNKKQFEVSQVLCTIGDEKRGLSKMKEKSAFLHMDERKSFFNKMAHCEHEEEVKFMLTKTRHSRQNCIKHNEC